MKLFALIIFLCICWAAPCFAESARPTVNDNLAVVSSISYMANYSGNANQIVVKDSVTAHTIVINCAVNFEHVTVNFASGIHIDACANTGAPDYGMSDGSSFLNCKVPTRKLNYFTGTRWKEVHSNL